MDVIPHGAHDVPRHDPALLQKALAIQGSPVLVTFGLMSPGKGIEYMLDALPAVVSRHPRAVYLVVGATHPAVEREQGQGRRETELQSFLRKGQLQSDHALAISRQLASCLLSTDYRGPAVFGEELEHRFPEPGT